MVGFPARQRDESASPATDLPLGRMIALRSEAARRRTLSRQGVTSLPGLTRTRLRGAGLDFDEVRPYADGDDVRHIDWNVTARTGRAHTRLYREERERALTVALDLRASMFTGARRLKAVAAGEMAAAILWQVAANRDRAGALVFDDHHTDVSRPLLRERGVLDALGLVDAAFAAARKRVGQMAAAACPWDGGLPAINRLGRNAGLTVLVTDCAAPGPHFDAELAIAARRQRLAVLRVADAMELYALPPGSYPYAAESRPRRFRLDRGAARALQAELDRLNAALAGRFESAGVPYVVAPTTLDAGDGWRLLAEAGLV
jgi:uncharacterized protein (DUF58 family)